MNMLYHHDFSETTENFECVYARAPDIALIWEFKHSLNHVQYSENKAQEEY